MLGLQLNHPSKRGRWGCFDGTGSIAFSSANDVIQKDMGDISGCLNTCVNNIIIKDVLMCKYDSCYMYLQYSTICKTAFPVLTLKCISVTSFRCQNAFMQLWIFKKVCKKKSVVNVWYTRNYFIKTMTFTTTEWLAYSDKMGPLSQTILINSVYLITFIMYGMKLLIYS